MDDRGRAPEPDSGRERLPVGFVVLVVAAAVYLLLRFIQMGGWLLDRLVGG